MFHNNGVLRETILVKRSRKDVGSYWSLGPGCYNVIGLSKLETIASIMLLTNESITTALHPNLCTIKVEFDLKSIMLFSDSMKISSM